MLKILDSEEGRMYFSSKTNENQSVRKKQLLFLFGLATITIAICSKSSPLYPINDAPDANAYMTMGKSIWHGSVPYKDLYDHKGPFLYVIHALGSLISRTSFIGIYLFEVAACFFFLFMFYKSLRLYLEEECILMMPFIAAFVYASPGFINGDSPEEFSLPFLMYGMYIGIKSIRNHKLPSVKESVFIGITSGCVFWMKFTMCAFYIGWVIVPFYIAVNRRVFLDFLKMIFLVLSGVLVVTIPYLLYFGLNNAIYDWFDVYFYDNIFRYSDGMTNSIILDIIRNSFEGFSFTYLDLIPFYFMLVFGLVWSWISDSKRIVVYYICCFLIMHVVSYSGGRSFRHYTLLYLILSFPGWVAFYHIISCSLNLRKIRIVKTLPIHLIACGFSLLVMIGFGKNIHLLGMSRNEHPLYQMKEIIENDMGYNSRILNYKCVDLGMYTVMDIYPICRFYYIPNMIDSVGIEEQDRLLEQDDSISFVVAQHKENPVGYELKYYEKFRIEEWLAEYCLYGKTH